MRYAKLAPKNGLSDVKDLWSNQAGRNKSISFIENVKKNKAKELLN